MAGNLVPYMTGTMHLGNAAAANTVTNFIGSSFMLCLLGVFIADTYLAATSPSPFSPPSKPRFVAWLPC
jgi:dipeptide/tripeptide permease